MVENAPWRSGLDAVLDDRQNRLEIERRSRYLGPKARDAPCRSSVALDRQKTSLCLGVSMRTYDKL